jgi:hypothetical protein
VTRLDQSFRVDLDQILLTGTKPPSAPIYGAIVGCCGRAPYVHYYRQGQRCCPDGQVVDARAPCDIEIMG